MPRSNFTSMSQNNILQYVWVLPFQNKSLALNQPQSDFDNWPNSHQQKRNKTSLVTVGGQLGTVSSHRRKSQTLNNIGQQNSILSVGKYWKLSKPKSALRQIGWTRSNYCIFLRVHRILNIVWRNRSCYILFERKNAYVCLSFLILFS